MGAADAARRPAIAQSERSIGPEAGHQMPAYALLQCCDDSEYVHQVYGGYLRIYHALLGGEGETWRAFRVAHGELPDDAELGQFDGFVISGSCADAHGDEPWVLALVRFLRRVLVARKRVLGFCFGHQILSRALGGKVGRAARGWDIGVTCIHPNPATVQMLSSLGIPSHLPVIEVHRDEVLELPAYVEVMAMSNKTRVEMFRCRDYALGIQGHPEYTKDILMSIADRLLRNDLIQSSQVEDAKASFTSQEPARSAWRKLCKSFLEGKLPFQ